MINQLLTKLGFTDKETAIYLALLTHGKMSPQEIARITRINRPTVYSATKALVEKGVLLEDLGGTALLLHAKKPEDLVVLVNREQKALDEKKKTLQSAVMELNKLAQSEKYDIPKIVFVPEEEVRDYFFKQTPKWHASMMQYDKSWWGFQDHTFAEQYKDYIEWHWQNAPTNLSLHLLSNESKIENTLKQVGRGRREVRFWKGGGAFTASTWVCGDFVIMASTKNHPHYLVEIHDALFAHNLRELFKGVWQGIKA